MEENDPSYYDNINPDLLGAIPGNAEVVLEVGCGAGRLGYEYKRLNPQCRYYGIEIVPKAAAIAATRLDMACCGSAETIDLSFLNGTVDCIVYGDVLEHLVDPWALLKTHRALLSPTGKVVTCIPNVQNFSILLGLLHGRWDYADNGLLDRTHLRFFTLDGVVGMFRKAGFNVDGVVGRIVDEPRATAFVDALRPALQTLGVDENAFRQQSSAFQYLLTASIVA